MSFCKKSVHSFLCNFTNSKDRGTVLYCSPIHSRSVTSPAVDGLSFFTILKTQQSVNEVESAAIEPPPLLPPPPSPPASVKRDPGGIGFLDEVGGSVNGLMSCTESLGFESSDERRADDQTVENFWPTFSSRSRRNHNVVVKREVKRFPPPLSTLNCNGKPTFFLRPVRTDGRLELTEVRIHRPEILHASRQDGRLRLDFIVDEEFKNIKNEENDTEKVFCQNRRPTLDLNDDEEVENIENQNEDEKEKIIEEEVEESEEEIENRGVDEWKFPVKTCGGSKCFRRCHELSHSGGHHHNLHVWSQPCVTIR